MIIYSDFRVLFFKTSYHHSPSFPLILIFGVFHSCISLDDFYYCLFFLFFFVLYDVGLIVKTVGLPNFCCFL